MIIERKMPAQDRMKISLLEDLLSSACVTRKSPLLPACSIPKLRSLNDFGILARPFYF